MKTILYSCLLSICLLFLYSCSNAQSPKDTTTNTKKDMKTDMTSKHSTTPDTTVAVQKTEEEWKKTLTPEQYYILRQKGTERPFTGKFVHHKENGVYTCAACGEELFASDQKFDAHCGWPSFFDELKGGKIKTVVDKTHGMERTEIMCAKCGGHLGHIFDDGPNPTGLRYCVNSVSLDFKKK
jgi:methionine-R-sulfoxide reductase